jgi:plastocyanin
MKKSLLTIILIAPLALFAQTSHTINTFNFGFAPESLLIAAGDTVFVEAQNSHSATQISEANWQFNNPEYNGGFWVGLGSPTGNDWFILESPGIYYYICVPHAEMGMKGTITVTDNSVGIENSEMTNNFSISPQGNGNYQITFSDADQFFIITTAGKQMHFKALNSADNQTQISLADLPAGIYLGVFARDGNRIKVVKFLR